MDRRERVELAATRAGFKSVSALARACGTSPQAVQAFTTNQRPMDDLVKLIAEKTNVSEHWLRAGLEFDCPDWSRDIYQMERDLAMMEQLDPHSDPLREAKRQELILSMKRHLANALGQRKRPRLSLTLTVEPGIVGLKARISQLEQQLAAMTLDRDRLRDELVLVVRSKLVDQVGLPREQRTRYKPTPTPPMVKVHP
jgi:hypothetical protein